MNYILMNKNTPVLSLKIINDAIIEIEKVFNPEYLPVGVEPNSKDLNEWWKKRAIPASRDGIKDALYSLNISAPDELIIKCFGLSLSDQYWVNPADKKLEWADINFFENDFSNDIGEAIFAGRREEKRNINLVSPDNTSDGWLKKKWIIKDDKRYLIKAGSGLLQQEPYNEVVATEIFNKLDIHAVQYTLEKAKIKKDTVICSACENFITPDTELVTAWQLFSIEKKPNYISQYQHLINITEKLEIPNAQNDINNMLTVDYIIANSDRHWGNFGFIRNVNTLKYVSVAPIYDSGTSLWHNTQTQDIIPGRPPESKPFYTDHERQIKLVKNFEQIDTEKLKDIPDSAITILSKSKNINEERIESLYNALNYRVIKLQKHIAKTLSPKKGKSR